MRFTSTFTAALAMASIAIAAPAPKADAAPEEAFKRSVGYQLLTGDGSNWPGMGAWTDFETMWNANLPVLQSSCSQFGQANNSPEELHAIKEATTSVAATSGLDPRVIFAMIMQESGGCARAPTTYYSHANPGLMQCHNGVFSCNGANGVQNPCPPSTIYGMVQEGTMGTAQGDGLKQTLAKSGQSDLAYAIYVAARIYNSGEYGYWAGQDLSRPTAGTSCYASDVANRLMGWAAPATPCHLANP